MKKIFLICIMLIFGVVSTSFSTPVHDFDANTNEVLAIDNKIMPLNFNFLEYTAVSFEGIYSNQENDVSGTVSAAFASWTPNWFNRPTSLGRPDWGNFYFDLISNYTFSPKYSTTVPPSPVPEPATILLLGSGLIGLACVSRRRLKK